MWLLKSFGVIFVKVMSEMSEKNTFHIFTASVLLVIYVKYVFQIHASILANAWGFLSKKEAL